MRSINAAQARMVAACCPAAPRHLARWRNLTYDLFRIGPKWARSRLITATVSTFRNMRLIPACTGKPPCSHKARGLPRGKGAGGLQDGGRGDEAA